MGCGSSGGVPRADGNFGACDPDEPKNWRTRCSLAVRRIPAEPDAQATTVIVDTSPDFRLQCARSGVYRVDGVLFTHDHADQTHGIDDIRAFFLRQRRRIPCTTDAVTRASLMRRFGYIFESEGGYPAIADMALIPGYGAPFSVEGPSGPVTARAYDLDHGGVRSLGFRFDDVAYLPDVLDIPDESLEGLRDLDVLIVDALRYAPHPTHAHLDKALAWIEALKPRRAVLTNMHIDLDYETLSRELPVGVVPGYDGLKLTSGAAL
jgi:phosphoribosyl 1,2-cyclic phosphate phosphodiesterase